MSDPIPLMRPHADEAADVGDRKVFEIAAERAGSAGGRRAVRLAPQLRRQVAGL